MPLDAIRIGVPVNTIATSRKATVRKALTAISTTANPVVATLLVPARIWWRSSVESAVSADANINGNDAVIFVDLSFVRLAFFGAPGPSGIAP